MPSNVVGIDGGRTSEISKTPPRDVPEVGTLTLQTEAAFRLLCELDAEKRATKATLDHDGRTYIKVTVDGAGQEQQELKAHPLTGSYRQLAQRVEALMARFSLAPFGKPVAMSGKKKPVANPWLAITTKR
jgi:hypothetical protein